jgi:hypothetical protein
MAEFLKFSNGNKDDDESDNSAQDHDCPQTGGQRARLVAEGQGTR